MTFTRKNAWNQGGTFKNPDLYWYAKAVAVMQSRELDDLNSWWFFAAIHGTDWPKDIPPQPTVPKTPMPSQSVIDQYWAQCQHGTWFFPPWHRGYLYAFENVLRGIIISLGGPNDWALPYWNYFGPGDQYQIPPAFTASEFEGGPNPLMVNARYGPNGDGNIFIPFSRINQKCQLDPAYTGLNPNFYGGGETGFSHYSGNAGGLEYNPHNLVHNAIGGQDAAGSGGLMGDPETAGLDPIFYLHHCNIDRMWAAWNEAGNSNPTDDKWLNGPTATGNRKFYMPKPDKTAWEYTPAMVTETSLLDYTYEDLSLGIDRPLLSANTLRLRNFGLALNENKLISDMKPEEQSELVGANKSAIKIDATGARTTVRLDSKGWTTVSNKLTNAFKAGLTENPVLSSLPDNIYLRLEGIKGKEDSIECSVSVNNVHAGHLSLFGLRGASKADGAHGGAGLTINFDITKIVDELHLNNASDLNSLDVAIQPVNIVAEGNEVTIDRVSIYRQG